MVLDVFLSGNACLTLDKITEIVRGEMKLVSKPSDSRYPVSLRGVIIAFKTGWNISTQPLGFIVTPPSFAPAIWPGPMKIIVPSR